MDTTNRGTLLRRGGGFALEGPGYYLWDEDPREVLRAAAELVGGQMPSQPTRRMLVLTSPGEEPLHREGRGRRRPRVPSTLRVLCAGRSTGARVGHAEGAPRPSSARAIAEA